MTDDRMATPNQPGVPRERVREPRYVQDGDIVQDGDTAMREPARPTAPEAAAPVIRDETVPAVAVAPARDAVRWGPVWGGLLAGFATFLVLELLAYAVGLLTTTTSGGNIVASDASPWITGVLSLIAFFVGGYVAERSSAVRGTGAGLLNGFMVWALGVGLILAFSIVGVGSLFGALGNAIGQVLASGGRITTPGNVNSSLVATVSQNVALGAFAWLLLSAILAAAGGWLGSIGRATGYLTDRTSGRVFR
ncbi:MAG TPA: hypothetical protein VFU63_09810 [Ktedonobacterales bacterium]|nr:hypothetical protein [Ktedonobacterales bacterium]